MIMAEDTWTGGIWRFCDFDMFLSRLMSYGYTGDCTVEATAVNENGGVDFYMLNDCFKRIRNLLDNHTT